MPPRFNALLSNPLLDYGVFNLQAMDLIKNLLFQSSALEGDSERHRFYTRLDRCVLQGLSRRVRVQIGLSER